LSDQVKRLAGEDTIVSDLTYDLRSGEPDFVDKMVATTFANMALECLAEGRHGRMVAIQNGCYVDAELPDPDLGPRRVDVATMYNVDRYRPNYAAKGGLPIFLTRA
jgi:6-phosphofructokinase 1